MMSTESPDTKMHTWPAFAAAWPICLGYLAIGMAFGVLARQEGLAIYQIALMSCIVFAGSAQFIASGKLRGTKIATDAERKRSHCNSSLEAMSLPVRRRGESGPAEKDCAYETEVILR